MAQQPPFVTVAEAAAVLKISPQQVRWRINRGHLKGTRKIGPLIIIPLSSIKLDKTRRRRRH